MKTAAVFVWIALLVLVLSLPQTRAADTQLGDKTYTINFPKNDYYLIASSPRLYVQAQNYTGLFLSSPAVGCRIQVYNSTGVIITSSAMTYSAPYNYYYDLPNNISTRSSIYPYDVYCNSSDAGGFASANFKIGESAYYNSEISPGMVMLLGLFLLVIGFFAVQFWVKKHPLVYMFTLLMLFTCDAILWTGWKVSSLNFYAYVGVYYTLYLAMLAITFVMAIVTMLDITRMVMTMIKKKQAAENIARFGYA